VVNTWDGARGDRRVALDDRLKVAAHDHDAEVVRGDVEQEHRLALSSATRACALNAGAEGDDLVGVHGLAGLEPEELLHHLLDFRGARLAADEDDVLELFASDPASLERLVADLDAALARGRRRAPRTSRG
jgi:hypothetical protein